MGQKKQAEEETKGDEKKGEESEDTPLIKDLKKLDEEYLSVEREYTKKVQELQKTFEEKQSPLLEQRRKKLEEGTAKNTGTPACEDFWLLTLQNHPEFEDKIQDWDENVLKYLKDIQVEEYPSEKENESANYKIQFFFAENPFFSNEVLTKTILGGEEDPWTGEMTIKSVKSDKVEWKPGKDVTVETTAKKVKGGGVKKAKAKGKVKEEARPSFFRAMFRDLEEGMDLDDLFIDPEELDDEELDEDALGFLMESDQQAARVLKENIIPYAVRWYTGEAAPDDDDDDDDEEDEEEDDDDDDDSEDESPAPKKKGATKKKGGSAKSSPEMKPKEECKQQ